MRTLLLLLLVMLSACSDPVKTTTPVPQTPPTPDVKKVVDTPVKTKAEAKTEAKDKPWPKTHLTKFVITPPKGDEPMVIQGNKFLSIGRAPKLIWTETVSSIKLVSEPKAGSKVVSKKKLASYEEIPWKQNKLIINKPRPFIAKRDLTLTPPNLQKFHKLAPNAWLNHGEELKEFKIKKGQQMDVYMKTINSRCLVGLEGVFSFIVCPDPTDFSCEHVPINHSSAPYLPLEEQRWYQIEGDDGKLGWLRADNSPILDTPKKMDRATGLFK